MDGDRTPAAVPVALAEDGTLVRPVDARVEGRYRCPGCDAEVVLRRGERRRPHFAHRGGEGCSGESALHRAAKRLVLRVVEEWRRGGPRPCVSRPCPRPSCEGGVVQDLPADVTRAAAEVRLPGGVVADVVLYRGAAPAVVVELRATHAVGAEKARRFDLPWMELRAADVLDRPFWWVVVQDGLRPFECPACAARGEELRRDLVEIRSRALRVAEGTGQELPASPPYACAPHACWRCGGDMVVFAWPGSGEHSPRRPPEPVPSSVRHVVTEGAGNYWANCCPHCSAVQGDYHLLRDNAAYARVLDAL